jgi:hypothetical protein
VHDGLFLAHRAAGRAAEAGLRTAAAFDPRSLKCEEDIVRTVWKADLYHEAMVRVAEDASTTGAVFVRDQNHLSVRRLYVVGVLLFTPETCFKKFELLFNHEVFMRSNDSSKTIQGFVLWVSLDSCGIEDGNKFDRHSLRGNQGLLRGGSSREGEGVGRFGRSGYG